MRKKQYKNRRISPRQRRNRRILGAAIAAILIVLFLTSFFARPEPRIWYSYEVRDVVCDYGVYENGELKLILNSRRIALEIVKLLEEDDRIGKTMGGDEE